MFADFVFGLIKWTFILCWRFFTGAHMDGEVHSDATFFKPATARHWKRQQTNATWKCMSRFQRMKWRNGVFWPSLLLAIGSVLSPSTVLIVLGFLGPGLALIGWKHIRLAFWLPVVATHSDGSVHQRWILKPKYRRLLQRFHRPEGVRKRPGLALASELVPSVHLEDIPPDYEAAVRAELAEELDGQPFVEMKLLMVPDEDEGR